MHRMQNNYKSKNYGSDDDEWVDWALDTVEGSDVLSREIESHSDFQEVNSRRFWKRQKREEKRLKALENNLAPSRLSIKKPETSSRVVLCTLIRTFTRSLNLMITLTKECVRVKTRMTHPLKF